MTGTGSASKNGPLFAVMCVRNEEYYLPGFLKHISPYVDGIVALDDGSTDSTVKLLEKTSKVVEIIRRPVQATHCWDEVGNREILLTRAREIGGQWALCCDPDERFEQALLENLQNLICEKRLYAFRFRELWDSTRTYRNDGVWATKKKQVLFPLADEMTFTYPHKLHRPWYYDELRGMEVLTEYNLYHLKMIKPQDREKRRDLYNALDPNREMQAIGYDYLTDTNGLTLETIPEGKDYNRATLPFNLRVKSMLGG